MTRTLLVTGSCGLVGSEACRYFAAQGFRILGIDNDQRARLFGEEASTRPIAAAVKQLPGYHHFEFDLRDRLAIDSLFSDFGRDLAGVIHCAAQPSHDWAAQDPLADFEINAGATLKLLEATRRFASAAPFIFMSTNKVYGDGPNSWDLREGETRFESVYGIHCKGIREDLSVDRCTHSLFGCSKLAADLYVQEYGRYFGMKTVCFRAGCLTGPTHAGAKQHGFLSYLVRCAMKGEAYEIIGYGGKQVRDNLHALDLTRAFDEFLKKPGAGAVYNIGGGRQNSSSVREAIALVERVTGRKVETRYNPEARRGDHIWWISDHSRFRRDYPAWDVRIGLEQIIREIAEAWEPREVGEGRRKPGLRG